MALRSCSWVDVIFFIGMEGVACGVIVGDGDERDEGNK